MNTTRKFFVALFVLVALVGAFIVGRKTSNQNQPMHLVAETLIPTSTATATSNVTSTATPTVTAMPTMTPEILYTVNISLTTSAMQYGAYHLLLDLVEDRNGQTFAVAQETMRNMLSDITSECKYDSAGNGYDYAYAWSYDSNIHTRMTKACWDILEELSGQQLERNDVYLGDWRAEDCYRGKDCVFLDQEQLDQIEADVDANLDRETILQDTKGNSYFQAQSWSRNEPNALNWSGFGLKWTYPTEILLEAGVKISQVGINNWGGKTLCYVPAEFLDYGELGRLVPSKAHQKCIQLSDFATGEPDRDWWDYIQTSYSRIGDMHFVWSWIPTARSEFVLEIKVIDVSAFKMIPTKLDSIAAPVPDGAVAANTIAWEVGEQVSIVRVHSTYVEVLEQKGWRMFRQVFLAVELLRKTGEIVMISDHFGVHVACSRDCYYTSYSDSMPEYLKRYTISVEDLDSPWGITFWAEK